MLADGTIEGFVGGTCAESTVRAQGLALLTRASRCCCASRPTPEAGRGRQARGAQPVPVRRHAGDLPGAGLPAPAMLIVGAAPVREALAGARPADRVACRARRRRIDHRGLRRRIRGRRRLPRPRRGTGADRCARGGRAVRRARRQPQARRGRARIARHVLGARRRGSTRRPGSTSAPARRGVALSILAEIVSLRPRPSGRPVGRRRRRPRSTATDPVCGMTVATVDSSLHLDHDGTRQWFCGSGCLRAFAANPGAYLGA